MMPNSPVPADTLDLTKLRISLSQVIGIFIGLFIAGGMWAILVYQVSEARREITGIKAAQSLMVSRSEWLQIDERLKILEHHRGRP